MQSRISQILTDASHKGICTEKESLLGQTLCNWIEKELKEREELSLSLDNFIHDNLIERR